MRLFFIVILTLSSFVAQAGYVNSSMVQLSMATERYGNVRLTTPINEEVGVHPCINTTEFLSFDKTTQHGEQIYALLLSAYIAKKEVYFEYSATECGLWATQALITRVDLRN